MQHIPRKGKVHVELWLGNMKERGHLEELSLDWRLILKLISKNWIRGIDWCNRLYDLPDFCYNYLQLVVGPDPSQGTYKRNQKPLCSFITLYSLRFQQHKFQLLAVHLAFTTANSVHLCTTDYLISFSDTDTISEHLPTADIAENQFICERGKSAVSFIQPGKCKCAHQTNFTSSFSIYRLANARRPVYLLTFLVAQSEIRTTDPGRLHWIGLAEERDRWRALVNVATNFWLP